MNVCYLVGDIFKPAETRETQNGKTVANLVMRTSKKVNEGWQTEYHNIVFWNVIAARAKELKKGDRVFVKGEIQTSSWEKDGRKHYKTQVNCQELIVEPCPTEP